MLTWIGIVLASIVAAGAVFMPSVQDVVKDNPSVSATVAAVYAILMALSKSPIFKAPEK